VDLYRTIRTLHEERKRLEKLIESLESLQESENGLGGPKPAGRRGRKGMNADERRKVSERMKKYWENRRAVQKSNGSVGPAISAASTGTD
jgi:hypothetical protein